MSTLSAMRSRVPSSWNHLMPWRSMTRNSREQHGAAGRLAPSTRFAAIPMADTDLSEPLGIPEPNAMGQLLIVSPIHGRLIGTLLLHDVAPECQLDAAGDALATAFAPPTSDALPELSCPRPIALDTLISVAVRTLGHKPRLRNAIASVLAQDHPDFEVLVVDNAPETGATRSSLSDLDDARLGIVDEPRRGLWHARNRALAAASGGVIAFTNDDGVANPGWARTIAATFTEHADIDCVTGLGLPAELATSAQIWLEQFGAFDMGFGWLVWRVGRMPERLADLGAAGRAGRPLLTPLLHMAPEQGFSCRRVA